MSTRDLVRAVTKWSGKEYLEVAEQMGLNKQRWYRRLDNGTFTVSEFLDILELCGCELAIIKGDEAWTPKVAHGSLRAKSKGKRYSTSASRPLVYDGCMELCIDKDGDCFLADYEARKVTALNRDEVARILTELCSSRY